MRQLFAIIVALAVISPVAAFADAEAELTDAIRAAAAEAAPSVLRIETFGGLEKVGDVLVGSGPSTGLVLSEDGFVLCSAYSFAQQPTSVLVTLPSGKRAAAKIVARDNSRMLVLLKVNTDEALTPPQLVARNEMQVGQTAIAMGRTFDAKTPNLSVGILSATHRIWGKAIQTDAKISPSNYGGPLIDLRGRVLGILVPMSPQGEGALAGAEWYDSGIGFAVPLAAIASNPSYHCVTFLSVKPKPAQLALLSARDFAPERWVLAGREIHSWHPNGQGRSALSSAIAKLKLEGAVTTRNWKTVQALAELLG